MTFSDVIEARVEMRGPIEEEDYTRFESFLVNADTGRRIPPVEVRRRFRQLKITGVHVKPAGGRRVMKKLEDNGYPGFAMLVDVIDGNEEEDIAVLGGGEDERVHIPASEFHKLYQLD